MRNRKNFRGAGIAAAGYLTVAASAVLIVAALKMGALAAMPRWSYLATILLGFAGVALGFLLGLVGIVITWASFGNGEVDLGWLTERAKRLERWRPAILFRLSSGSVLVAVAFAATCAMGFGSIASIAGFMFLAAATFLYFGIISKLWLAVIKDLGKT